MSLLETVIGVLKTFVKLTKEEWNEMDHKLLRVGAGLVGFLISAAVWYYFFRGPFK